MVKEIQYKMDTPPEFGVPVLIAKGIYMLRLPLPFALDHVNVWLLEDDESWTIIDTGLGDAACLAIWDDLLASFLKQKPVRKIILTHYHPDHVGLSGDLVLRTGADVYMSRTEWLTANMLYHDEADKLGQAMIELFFKHGLPDELTKQMSKTNNIYRSRCSILPSGYHQIKQGDEISMAGSLWRCREGQGHSPEHMAFFCEDRQILIAGDHILPKITPNIPMQVQQVSANPIASYIDSLGDFKDIDDGVLILPSHRLPFEGVQIRIQQLIEHHHQRLQTLLDACEKRVTAFDVLPILFKRELDLNQMKFAMLEALSHLIYLEKSGDIERQLEGEKFYFKLR